MRVDVVDAADREISLVRTTMDGTQTSGRIRCRVERSPGGAEMQVRFVAPWADEPGLGPAAVRAAAEVAARLPSSLRPRLTVEAGLVRTRVRAGGTTRSLHAGYCIALWRGAVLGVWGLRRRPPMWSRWEGVAETADLRPELPVVLGPSAALSLVAFGLEALGAPGGPAVSPVLTVVDGAASPYPPQDLSWAPAAAGQTLIAAGRWTGQGGAQGGVDPLFFLLTRPERALRPHGVSVHFERRNLEIGATVGAPLPRRALIVDAVRALAGPRRGSVPFEAEVSLRTADGGQRALPAPIRLEGDPWELLERVRAGHGRPLPAVDRDPIEGDSYGAAPFLLLELTCGELLEPAGRA